MPLDGVTQANNYADAGAPSGALMVTLANGKPGYYPMGQAVPAGLKVTGTKGNPKGVPGGYVTIAGKAKYLGVGAAVPAGAKAYTYATVITALATAALPYRYQTAYNDLSNSIAHIKATSVLDTAQAEVERYYKYAPALTRGILVPNGYPYLQTGMYGASTNCFPRIIPIQPYIKDATVVTWTNPNINAAWAETLASAYPQLAQVKATDKAAWSTIIAQGTVTMKDSEGNACAWRFRGAYFAVNWAAQFDDLFQRGKIFFDPTSGYAQQTYKSWLSLDFFESTRNLAEAVVAAVGIAYVAAAAVGTTATTAGGTAATGAGAGDATAADIGTTDIITTAPEAGDLPILTGTDLTSGLTALAPVTLADAAGAATGLGSLLKTGTALLGAAAAAAAKSKPTATKPVPAAKTAGTAAGSISPAAAIIAAIAGAAGLGLLFLVAQGA